MIQHILFPQYIHFQPEKVPSLYNTISTKIDLYPVISGCKFYRKWLSCLLLKQKLSNHLSKVNNKLKAAKYFLTILFANQDFLKTVFLEFLYGQKKKVIVLIWHVTFKASKFCLWSDKMITCGVSHISSILFSSDN